MNLKIYPVIKGPLRGESNTVNEERFYFFLHSCLWPFFQSNEAHSAEQYRAVLQPEQTL